MLDKYSRSTVPSASISLYVGMKRAIFENRSTNTHIAVKVFDGGSWVMKSTDIEVHGVSGIR